MVQVVSTSSSSSGEMMFNSLVGYREVGHGARQSQRLEVRYGTFGLWLKEKKKLARLRVVLVGFGLGPGAR